MVGTHSIFYLVPVNRVLSDVVTTGRYPSMPTKLQKCVTVGGHNRSSSEGKGGSRTFPNFPYLG